MNNSSINPQENKNLNHHSIVGCTSGYKQTQEWPSIKLVASFHYPFSRPEFLQKWITFTDRKEWTLKQLPAWCIRNIFMKMLWVKSYKESTLSQLRVDLIVEGDSSMNQILHYGENHFRLEIWSQISCLISSLKTAFHRMRKLKESIVHPPVKSVKPNIE